jgi:hypothetical protein
VTYYSYDANQIDRFVYDYKLDEQNNWIEKKIFANDTLQGGEIRKILYKY